MLTDLSPQFPGQEIHKDKSVSECREGLILLRHGGGGGKAVIFRVHSLLQNPFAVVVTYLFPC